MEEAVKRHLIESFREKYHRGGRCTKSEILQQVQNLLSCHRKHAIRVMKKRIAGRKPPPAKRGKPSVYQSSEFIRALYKVRCVMEFRNAESMKGNMAEWLPFIESHYGAFEPQIRELLLKISISTMKRLLKRLKEQSGVGLCTTRPGSTLRTEIPIRTDSFSNEARPGKMATDTVAHCGASTGGEYIFSLDMVDPVTHWTAQRAVWGKGSAGVLEQTKSIEQKLPYPMTGLHVDNGSEFINYHYIRYFTNAPQRTNFAFTRSRPNKKNDNAHVEQKNWSVVRRYLGYERMDFLELVPMINDLYENELYLYLNHFCRTFKLSHKIAIKSRYRRVYTSPETPYERVLNSPFVSDDAKNRLREEHKTLDPVALKLIIERKLKNIFATLRKLRAARSSASAA